MTEHPECLQDPAGAKKDSSKGNKSREVSSVRHGPADSWCRGSLVLKDPNTDLGSHTEVWCQGRIQNPSVQTPSAALHLTPRARTESDTAQAQQPPLSPVHRCPQGTQ